jgi:protein-S-isoprenylcysteine O-methyltransferase Ste14
MPVVKKTKMLPPIWLALALIAMFVLHYFAPLARLISSPWTWLGAIPIVAGIALAVSGAALFKRQGTGVVPFTPVTALVTAGPYRFTRNPMYLGMVMLLSGVAIMLGTLTPWIVIPLFTLWIAHRFIAQEEVMLEEVFGEDYVKFKRRVRRWI